MGTISIGANTYEVYGDEAGAKAYFAAAAHAASYVAAESSTKKKAHISATRMLDRQAWMGERVAVAPGQPLEFPRTGLVDKDGNAVSSGSIPVLMDQGCYELMLAILDDEAVQASTGAGSNVRRTRSKSGVGPLAVESELEYFKPTLGRSGRFPQIVQEIVGVFLAGSSMGSLVFSSGTEAESEFSDGQTDFGFGAGGIP